MSIMITEVASLLEEATRRQEVLLTQVLKLKSSLDRVRMPEPAASEKDPSGSLTNVLASVND